MSTNIDENTTIISRKNQMRLLKDVKDIIKKTTPATKTAPSASAGVYSMPKQTP